MSLKLPVALFETTITETISKTATTIPLASLSDGEGGTLTNGSVKGFIIDEGEDSGNTDYGQEYVIGTVDTAGVRLTGCLRGVSFVDGITEKVANQKKHRRGASIKNSSHPYLVAILRVLNGTDQFDSTAIMAYNGAPAFTPGSNQLATIAYADALAIAGAPNATTSTKGIAEEATQAELAAGTAAGGTAARLFANPSTLAAHIQSNAWLSGVTAGTADAITATLTPTLTALTHNMMVVLHVTTANNAGATLNIDGLGAKAIYKYAGGSAVAVEANDMKALYHHVFLYDSDATVFLLVNPVNGTLTAAMQTEIQNVFAATDVTGAELETLTSAATNNADSLHGHAGSFTGMSDTFLLDMSTETVNYPVVGYSDATVKLITNGFNTTAPATYAKCLALAPDYGHAYYTKVLPVKTAVGNRGALYIGTDLWTTDNNATAGNRVQKNGSNVTISGTTPSNNARGLAHDPTNSYLLLLDTTTTVQRYSGIAGTTITHVSTVTLDTAVSVLGFLYDNTNSRYICLDLSGNLIRRFNASGTTIDTAAFTVDDTVAGIGGVLTIAGLVFIRDRVHIAYVSVTDAGTPGLARIEYIPTTMTR